MHKNVEGKVKNLLLHTEKYVESKLIRLVKSKNGMCKKLQGVGNKSIPDRFCLFPGGKVWFVELKKPGKKPNPLQLYTHAKLREMGFKVNVIWNDEQLKQFESEIQAL